MKIQYREFEDAAMIAMGVGAECVGGWVMKITTEKIKLKFFIFSAVIFVTQFPLPSINSVEDLKFSKLFDEDAVSRIRESCDCDG